MWRAQAGDERQEERDKVRAGVEHQPCCPESQRNSNANKRPFQRLLQQWKPSTPARGALAPGREQRKEAGTAQ